MIAPMHLTAYIVCICLSLYLGLRSISRAIERIDDKLGGLTVRCHSIVRHSYNPEPVAPPAHDPIDSAFPARQYTTATPPTSKDGFPTQYYKEESL